MSTHDWDPERYLAYADERGRPFLDLVGRVAVDAPDRVVDLGCGPGNLTVLLARRWPGAQVVGVDSSADMIAATSGIEGVRFEVGDVRTWHPPGPVDVVVSNATLQWVPGHLDLLDRWVDHLAPGGALALQVPGNFAEPSHTIRQELAADPRFAPYLRGVASPDAYGPEVYLDVLARPGLDIDAWETTYLHVLTGDDPVFTWATGTGARPTLQALPDGLREEFAHELRTRLAAAYPRRTNGTVLLPFRRVFAVAHRDRVVP